MFAVHETREDVRLPPQPPFTRQARFREEANHVAGEGSVDIHTLNPRWFRWLVERYGALACRGWSCGCNAPVRCVCGVALAVAPEHLTKTWAWLADDAARYVRLIRPQSYLILFC